MEKYLIREDATIINALSILNSMSYDDAMTLVVVDENRHVIGTVTDGDIRRFIIEESNLNAKVKTVAHKNFVCLSCSKYDISKIKAARNNHIELIPIIDENRTLIDILNLRKQKSLLPIDAVLMAGGKGTRLKPLTDKTPKPLLLVGNKSIIDYNVERLVSYGIKNISVTVNYLKEQIIEHFSKTVWNIKVNVVEEPCYLGTIGSVQFINDFYNDTVLVMNSDLFTNIEYEDFYLHFKENNADMSIAAVPYSVSVPYGILDIDSRNVKGIIEKPTYNYYANAGIYLINRELLKFIPKNTFFNATDLLNLMVENNKKVIRYPLNCTWIDIGNFQEYQKACELVNHIG